MFGRSNGEPREYQFHLSIARLKNYEKKKKRLFGTAVEDLVSPGAGYILGSRTRWQECSEKRLRMKRRRSLLGENPSSRGFCGKVSRGEKG